MAFVEDMYRNQLENLYDGVYCIDEEKRITYWNRGMERITGCKKEETMGKYCRDILMHVDDRGLSLCDIQCPIIKTANDRPVGKIELFIHHKTGYRIPTMMRIIVQKDEKEKDIGRIIGIMELFHDDATGKITYKKSVEDVEKLILLDSLTEVGNRRFIENTLLGRLKEMQRYNWPFGVIFTDLDHFKKINDGYGHDIGDEVLKSVAKILRNSARIFDLVGRWGGDEFIIILTNVSRKQLMLIAERIRSLVAEASFCIGSQTIKITLSIGATMVRKDDSNETLMKRTDELMYTSKNNGRNCVTIDPE